MEGSALSKLFRPCPKGGVLREKTGIAGDAARRSLRALRDESSYFGRPWGVGVPTRGPYVLSTPGNRDRMLDSSS